jgi:transposase-like protein
MQEKIVSTSIIRRQTSKEERQSHVENWKKSGLSMSGYCRQNNLAVANLSEWKKSLLRASTQFKSIKTLSTPGLEQTSNNTVEIIVDQRIKIRLHHVTDTSLVINIVKGLMICS